ncbi:MAG TPA: glucose-6-phosphate dehydrogenase [Candidatus Saccharimonadia bacterium]|nr:glucose-6-phosphate dehydrogenase [Candidatus Saccharimonadia bacterium]
MQNFSLVLFGVTGNLAQLKVLPALYDLEEKHLFPEKTEIFGVARRPMTQEQFQEYVASVLQMENIHHKHAIHDEVWTRLRNRLHYVAGDFNDASLYVELKQKLEKFETHNRIFYVATYPSLYPTIFDNLQATGQNKPAHGWARLMIEKPIGTDFKSAQALNVLLAKHFSQDQIYRLDHYLGKETLQNILTFRFGNGIFEPLMNRDHIDHIEVTAAEEFGIGERGEYYDAVGGLRDVGQNHILQMLTLVLMESPTEFSNEAVTKERVRVLEKLKPMPHSVVFGQYEGYQQEHHVRPGTTTDTFFAFKTELDTPRYAGVPIYVRAGKKLERTVTEISIVFKTPITRLFKNLDSGMEPNVLVFRVQPNEGIVLRILSKTPGQELKLEQSYMQFCYHELSSQLRDAYERLIADAIAGDQTFFNDDIEIDLQWKFIDPLFAAKKLPVVYKPGSWGPKEADELLKKDEKAWLEPSLMFCAR